jgi:hypothetical protein
MANNSVDHAEGKRMSDEEDDERAEVEAEVQLSDQIIALIAPPEGGVPTTRAIVAMAQAFAFLVMTGDHPWSRDLFNELVDTILEELTSPGSDTPRH